jgi:hypothetical protein
VYLTVAAHRRHERINKYEPRLATADDDFRRWLCDGAIGIGKILTQINSSKRQPTHSKQWQRYLCAGGSVHQSSLLPNNFSD